MAPRRPGQLVADDELTEPSDQIHPLLTDEELRCDSQRVEDLRRVLTYGPIAAS